MEIDSIISFFLVLIIILLVSIVLLIVAYVIIDRKKAKKKENRDDELISDSNESQKENKLELGRFKENLNQDSIFEFMEFDEIIDNMIVRKNKTQYIMVLQCNGVNYDLMSEAEKIGVEEGFVQFLNTLKFPVQLYVQSRTLNLKDIIQDYKNRVEVLGSDIEKLNIKIKQALNSGNRSLREKLEFEKKRKNNVLEYGMNIIEYVERMSSNKNILQQKTYVIIPYYVAELGGNIENFSKDEIDGMCFSELYTRAQNIISALYTSSVTSKILNSEELSELLYVAYNRDESELYQFSKALDAQYDALYSNGKDVLEKKEQMLSEQLNIDAIDLATDSILKADKRKKEEEFREELKKKQKIKQKALNLVQEYQNQLDPKVYDYSVEEIEKYGVDENEKVNSKDETPTKRKIIKRRTREE